MFQILVYNWSKILVPLNPVDKLTDLKNSKFHGFPTQKAKRSQILESDCTVVNKTHMLACLLGGMFLINKQSLISTCKEKLFRKNKTKLSIKAVKRRNLKHND